MAGICDDDGPAPGMRLAFRIPCRSAHTLIASRGPGDQHRRGRPGQNQGLRNRRTGDKRSDMFVVLSSGSRDGPAFLNGR